MDANPDRGPVDGSIAVGVGVNSDKGPVDGATVVGRRCVCGGLPCMCVGVELHR